MGLKLCVLLLMGSIAALIAACGGDDPTPVSPTPTPLSIQVRPTAVPPTIFVPGYSVSGDVLDSSTSFLLGGTLTLEPTGQTAITDLMFGEYEFTDVKDGEYIVTVTPACVAYGCYKPRELIVDGSDVIEFHFAPFVASLLRGGPSAARSIDATSSRVLALDEIELAATSVLLIGPNDMEPGGYSRITVAGPACLRCADLLEVVTPTKWSVSPSIGASIDSATGTLSMSGTASVGSIYTVTADLGAFAVTKEISVYSAEENPLVGVWTEQDTGNVGTLLLTSGGEFAATINPYGSYQDYWGDYTFDSDTGALELIAQGWNQVAPGVDGIGKFSIDAKGQLSLSDICLGRWDQPTQSLVDNCEHKFIKQSS